MNLIECKNITIGYNDKIVMKNLNFNVKANSYLCIIGSNGSGKSTLLKSILGLIKLKKGQIKLNGLTNKEIGYLPQINENIADFPATGLEIIASGLLNQKKLSFYTKKDKEKINNIINILKIKKIVNKSFMDMSGGERQKILLARALVATNKVLLLDEPTTGLDPKTQNEFYKLIDELNQQHDITIIMVSHDVHRSLEHATHILHLDSEDTFFGTPDEYQKSGRCEHFIGGCK